MPVDEVIVNRIPSDIPTYIFQEALQISENVSLFGNTNSDIAVIDFRNAASNHNWAVDGRLIPTYKFIVDLPIANHAGAFDTIIFDYFGNAYKIWAVDLHDPDPSGAGVIGVQVLSTWSQNQIIDQLALMMNLNSSTFRLTKFFSFLHTPTDPNEDPTSPFFGTHTSILIECTEDGPDGNSFSGVGNIVGGGAFVGKSVNGGYNMRSATTPDKDGTMHVTMWTSDTDNLNIQSGFLNGNKGNPVSKFANSELPRVVMLQRNNYNICVGASQLIIYPDRYDAYTPLNSDEVNSGTSDYHICTPHIPPELQVGSLQLTSNNGYGREIPSIRNPIVYCGFYMATVRTVMGETARFATCVNDFFVSGVQVATDSGVQYQVYNSRFHRKGPLGTTAGHPLQYSAVVGLAEGNSFFNREHAIPWTKTMAQVYAFVPNMYLTTEKVSLGARFIDSLGKTNRAYRTMEEPVEATLWLINP